MTVSLTPRGRTFARAIKSLAMTQSADGAALHATQLYGPSMDWEKIIKAAVTPILTGDIPTEQAAMSAEYFGAILEQSIVGRLSGRRDVPFRVRLIGLTTGSTGYWVSQTSPKPLSKPVLDGAVLDPLKVAAIIVLTKESIAATGPKAEAVFQSDLTRAVTAVLDLAFVDVSNNGISGETPAAVTSGVVQLTSTDNPGSDIVALIEHFDGDLASSYLITDPATATRLALARDSGGSFLFPDAGPRGGSIVGIPLLTSRSSPQDSSGGQIALIDASAVAVGLGGLAIDMATNASLEMSDAPDSPLTASTVAVSLWQQDLVALRCEIYGNWRLERARGVAVIAGATYSTVAA